MTQDNFNASESVGGTPRYPILSQFDPPLSEDQLAILRKIANVLATAAIQATDEQDTNKNEKVESSGNDSTEAGI